MKKTLHIIFPLLSAVIVGCTKTAGMEQSGDAPIIFYSRNVFLQTSTKGIIPDENMTLPIVVTDDSGIASEFTAREIPFNPTNNLWYDENTTWNTAKSYTIYAYIISEGAVAGTVAGGKIDIKEETNAGNKTGKNFSVSQPSAYSENPQAYSDFLLSYPKTVNGADKPVVTLDFERTMSCVELYITKTRNNPVVTVTSACFGSVYTGAEYSLFQHGDGNTNHMKNVWIVTENTRKDYKYSPAEGWPVQDKDTEDRFNEKYRIMQFLTPDQPLDGMHTLTITYLASETNNSEPLENTVTFHLKEQDVDTWAYGHRIRYYISIDTGASIEGVVDEWKNVGYIEGTFLPEQGNVSGTGQDNPSN